MRILHTSDWHLGRSFHRVGMLEHQAAFVDHLVGVVEAESVDLVVVAGDVYDRALPHVDAVALADEALARLAGSRAAVVISSGNHDSAQRLGFSSRLIDAAGVYIRTDPAGVGRPVVLRDEHGEVRVHALPYLDPIALHEPWQLPVRSHEAAVAEAMRRVRADLAAHPEARSVVLAHAFVAGAAPSDSERDISVGGISIVPTSVFDGVTYTALGHLHGQQLLTESVRYSGSPLAYSFSEAGHEKGCWLVDLGPEGVTAAEFVTAPVPRALARLSGSLDDLLDNPAHAWAEQAWVQATLTDPQRPVRAMERLQTRFPHTLEIAFTPSGERAERHRLAARPHRPGHEIAADFVREMRGAPATPAEHALLVAAFDACGDDPDADPVAR
ncbi:exonuclease SbcCD subunit D [Nocardioides cynanchi]|uniref:exonuclease SbcCD subunit D n=1 Tax=Nocardioides cynanchi TaxID=2558918 RepID=UPI0012440C5E|nr:exonuclease SbcCD subunit D [Nocardioides cynanchi]